MSKMKETTKHVHSVKYSSKEDYLEEEGPKKLKAIFRIQQKHKRVYCVVRDERFFDFAAALIDPTLTEEGTLVPNYWNSNMLFEYISQFLKQEGVEFTAVAKCHPEDAFDIQAGKDVALKKALKKRTKAISVVKRIMVNEIGNALGHVDDQLIYNVHPDPSKNPNLRKMEAKQIENKAV